MERGRGSFRTMKHQRTEEQSQKANKFAQYAMISVRWHEFVQ